MSVKLSPQQSSLWLRKPEEIFSCLDAMRSIYECWRVSEKQLLDALLETLRAIPGNGVSSTFGLLNEETAQESAAQYLAYKLPSLNCVKHT